MSTRSIVASVVLVSLSVLVVGAGSFATRRVSLRVNLNTAEPMAVTQAKSSDDKILDDVVANVRKAFTDQELKDFKALKQRFGFTCKNGVVTIIGTLRSRANRQKVITAVQKTRGVKRVVHQKTFRSGGGCGQDEQDCFNDGTVCVPVGQQCPERECC